MTNLKIRIVTLCLVILMFVFTSGCAKSGKCDNCGQNEKLNKFVETNGDVSWYCDDCYRLAKLFS